MFLESVFKILVALGLCLPLRDDAQALSERDVMRNFAVVVIAAEKEVQFGFDDFLWCFFADFQCSEVGAAAEFKKSLCSSSLMPEAILSMASSIGTL